jgi:hypothetical protein
VIAAGEGGLSEGVCCLPSAFAGGHAGLSHTAPRALSHTALEDEGHRVAVPACTLGSRAQGR